MQFHYNAQIWRRSLQHYSMTSNLLWMRLLGAFRWLMIIFCSLVVVTSNSMKAWSFYGNFIKTSAFHFMITLVMAILVMENSSEGQKTRKVLYQTWSYFKEKFISWKMDGMDKVFLAKFYPSHGHNSLKHKVVISKSILIIKFWMVLEFQLRFGSDFSAAKNFIF